MALPTIRGFGGTNSGGNGTSTTVDIAARAGVTPNIGDLVIIGIWKDGTGSFTWPTENNSWISLSGYPVTFVSAGVLDIRYKFWVAGDNASPVITHASEGTAHQVYVIDGSGPLQVVAPTSATPATNTSTNPDPPSNSFSWGTAEDSLMLVFAANDGNIAITAAPTNYTNFQNDRWANTQGGGIASARRSANLASPENPGVFTMNSSTWAAGTIAIRGGLSIGATLNEGNRAVPEFFKARLPIPITVLSLAVNLLQTTLKPPDPAIQQTDWPNPLRGGRIEVSIDTRPGEDGDIAFIPVDWRNPDLVKRGGKDWQNWILPNYTESVQPPFYQTDYPNPLLKKVGQGYTFDRPQYYTDEYPKSQTDFPNPLSKKQQNKGFWEERPQYYQDTMGFNQYDWPNPIAKKGPPKDWIEFQQLETSGPAPFTPIDYPNPLRKGQQNRGFTKDRPQFYIDLTPNNQFNWPLPLRQKKTADTWTQNLQQYTLAPAPSNLPFLPALGRVFPKQGLMVDISSKIHPEPGIDPQIRPSADIVPFRNTKPRQDWSYNTTLKIVPPPPNRQSDWFNPSLKPKINQGFTKSQSLESVVGNPFFSNITGNPLQARRLLRDYYWATPSSYVSPTGWSCIITLGIGPAISNVTCYVLTGLIVNPQPITYPPFSAALANPLYRKYLISYRGWQEERPFFYNDLYPTGVQSTSNPLSRKQIATQQIINPRPFYFIQPTAVPFNQTSWPTPGRKSGLIVDMNTFYGDLPVGGNPRTFNTNVNPLRKKTYHQDYRFYYVQDTNTPFPRQHTEVPLRKRRIAETWIQRPLVASPITNLPVGKSSLVIPIYKTIQGQTWLSDSLAVSDVPISQQDWPNPLRRAKTPVYDWIKEHPFYYEDTAPFYQTDYPNPLQAKKNTLSHIFIPQLIDTDIYRTFDYPNPLLKKKVADTWIIDLLQTTLDPGPGAVPVGSQFYDKPLTKGRPVLDWLASINVNVPIIPFSQTDWPNPAPVKKVRIDWNYFSSISESLAAMSITDVPLRRRQPVYDWLVNLQNTTLSPLPQTSFTQKDWPNPQYKRRATSLLTFISDYARYNPGNAPFKFTEWQVPLKAKIAGSWTDNPIITILTPPGETPFAQYDWTVPVRVRRAGQDYIQRAYILPVTGGRVICLISRAEEYSLESHMQIYELDSRFEVYQLESGGDECQ